MDRKLIALDLDGTIIDSVPIIVDFINEVALEHDREEFASIELLRSTPQRVLLRKAGVSFWQVPGILKEYREAYRERLVRVRPHPHVVEALGRLKEHADLAVISTNPADLVEEVLTRLGIRDLFSLVDGGSFFGKNRLIRKAAHHLSVLPMDVCYVGDETRDVHAARRAGGSSCAVSWGMHEESLLLKARPTMLARSAHALEELLGAWLDGSLTARTG